MPPAPAPPAPPVAPPTPRTPRRRLRRALAAALLLACAVPGVALGAESPSPTRQALAYGLDWLPAIDPADLPPVTGRAAVCLVDSGVAVDPDLPADRPEGPIVARTSVFESEGGLPGESWAQRHGTRMAAFAAAVTGDDWGTAGLWPAVRILSVRAMRDGEETFAADAYRLGMRRCREAAASTPGLAVAVVNLSLGCTDCSGSAGEQLLLADTVARVQAGGASVVAAAGNTPGPLASPADAPGVLPVAAGSADAGGGLCAYAAYAARALVGPGCGIDLAAGGVPVRTDGGGSSTAAVAASVVLALLRTLRPDATREQAEAWLWAGARPGADGRPALDGEGAARAAGLGGVVDRARARMAPAPVAPATVAAGSGVVASEPPAARDAPAPATRLTARWRAGTLRVRLAGLPARTRRLRVAWSPRPRGALWRSRVLVARAAARVHVAHRPARVRVTVLDAQGRRLAAPLTVALRGRG